MKLKSGSADGVLLALLIGILVYRIPSAALAADPSSVATSSGATSQPSLPDDAGAGENLDLAARKELVDRIDRLQSRLDQKEKQILKTLQGEWAQCKITTSWDNEPVAVVALCRQIGSTFELKIRLTPTAQDNQFKNKTAALQVFLPQNIVPLQWKDWDPALESPCGTCFVSRTGKSRVVGLICLQQQPGPRWVINSYIIVGNKAGETSGLIDLTVGSLQNNVPNGVQGFLPRDMFVEIQASIEVTNKP